jgi:cell division protein FtsB
MLNKIKSFINLSILLLCLVLIISLSKSIIKINGSDSKIKDAENSFLELKKENEALTKQLQTIKTTQFIERIARDKLGLAKKGEIVVVLPDSESLRALAPKVEEKEVTLPIPTWKKWLKLFL